MGKYHEFSSNVQFYTLNNYFYGNSENFSLLVINFWFISFNLSCCCTISCFRYSCLYSNVCSLWLSFGVYVTGILFQTATFVSFSLISHGYRILCCRLSLSERRIVCGLSCVLYLTLVGHRASVPYLCFHSEYHFEWESSLEYSFNLFFTGDLAAKLLRYILLDISPCIPKSTSS